MSKSEFKLRQKPKEKPDIKKESPEEDVIPRQLPKPTGYKLLIMLPEPEEVSEGGIIKAEQTKHYEEIGSVCGFVLAMGPDAYQGDRYSEPYCKVGDWVMMRAFSGTRFRIHGKEMRLINDDSVEAVVDDPRGIVKV